MENILTLSSKVCKGSMTTNFLLSETDILSYIFKDIRNDKRLCVPHVHRSQDFTCGLTFLVILLYSSLASLALIFSSLATSWGFCCSGNKSNLKNMHVYAIIDGTASFSLTLGGVITSGR